MINKVKKGSSLVMLVVLIALITTFGLALSTLSVSTYKMAKVNGIKKVNLYGAESGVDKAYEIIGQVVDKAIEKGKDEVKSIDIEGAKEKKLKSLIELVQKEKDINDVDDFNDLINSLKMDYINNINAKNDENTEFIELKLNENKDKSGNVIAVVNEEKLKAYQNRKFQKKYLEYITDNLQSKLEDRNNYGSKNYEVDTEVDILNFVEGDEDNPFEVTLSSSFTKDDIKKTIESSYEVAIPDYDDIYYMKSITFNDNIVWNKALAVNKNMDINSSNVEVNGKIFVKGDNGGIVFKGENSKALLNNEAYVASDILLNGENSNLSSTDNVYARNLIISENGEGSNILADVNSSIYLMDDLEVNGPKANVDIKGGFYGLSDGSSYSEPDHSSSIIVNTQDIGNGSSINIDGEIIIRGASYIQTKPKYETGESISIIGNYKAYMETLKGNTAYTTRDKKSLKEDNVQFEYMDPLNLVNKFKDGSTLNVFDKSDYFNAYNHEYQNSDDKLNLGGISIDRKKVISNTGALIDKGQIIKSKVTVNEGNIRSKERELKRNIYFMGRRDIEDGDIAKTNEPKFDVETQVDFSKLENKLQGVDSNNEVGIDKDLILLNRSSNKKYAFIGTNAETSQLPYGIEKINIKDNGNKGKFKGLIVSRGDIYICGNVDFTGTIITSGNLVFLDSNKKTINYDRTYIKSLVAERYDIFHNNSDEEVFFDEVGTNKKVGSNNVNRKIIKRKNWRLVK